jgi:hypothetical protein
MSSTLSLSGLETMYVSAAPWIYGIIIIVMLFSILWTFMGWNSPTKETNNSQGATANWNPFTISVIGLSSLVIVISLFYLTVGVVHESARRLTPLHSFYYYGSFLVLLASATMSIVNTTTDRPKRGDAIGITTLVLNILTLFISFFISSAFIRASIRSR